MYKYTSKKTKNSKSIKINRANKDSRKIKEQWTKRNATKNEQKKN